jgi:hypothetical protein
VEVAYDLLHGCGKGDDHGASLAAWVEQLHPRYRPVAGNLAGTNARPLGS